MFANCNRRTQPGVTERECDIVAALEVLVDQRLQRYVSQKVATVSKERFLSQLDFDVFDSAASLKQHRFVHKCERNSGIGVLRKHLREKFRQAMGVDEELLNSDVDRVIESKSDERLLKDRHQRFWQIVRERPKSYSKSGAEDECLFDPAHRARKAGCLRKPSGAAAPRNGRTSVRLFSNSWSLRQSLSFSSSWRGILHRRSVN